MSLSRFISPKTLSLASDEFIPLTVRMGYDVIGYLSDGWFGFQCKSGSWQSYCGSMISIQRPFSMGVYSWFTRLTNPDPVCTYFLGGFEFKHGNPFYGILMFTRKSNGNLYCESISLTGDAASTLVNVDPVGVHAYSIDWSSSEVTYFIDGVEVARHFPPNIPVKEMPFFFEVCRPATVSNTSFLEVKAGSFVDDFVPDVPAELVTEVELQTVISNLPETQIPSEYITESELEARLEGITPPIDNTMIYLLIIVIVILFIGGVVWLK